ncbi:Transcriptional regulatory protein YehT [Kordia antarctica]|uniref:Transcriptional regulatory protein YehT n=1 Tax=Kordia antarctica TaxID=1218801 RepID=A0A7L4ZKH6_9FLAO|nr:LytTR family DNA-binding domain-containing protein [Kordia antarctica]QHI37020.1 Transcriptional regulatory protein YehT [Kordia antarctica]
MKAILIDDEKKARNVLRTLLVEECPEITEIQEAADLLSGVEIIKRCKPDIVFLDIEMPEYSGLEILHFFKKENITFQIIFTTAYNKYAIEAFKIEAIDYLLKPIDDAELKNAVSKAQTAIKKNNIVEKLNGIEKIFNQISLNKIALEVPKGIMFVSYDDIIFFEADGVYTKVYLKNSKPRLISKTLKYFAQQLEDKPIFYRTHRSYLINLKFMSEVVKKDGLHVVLDNNKTIPIARDKKEEFLALIGSFF